MGPVVKEEMLFKEKDYGGHTRDEDQSQLLTLSLWLRCA